MLIKQLIIVITSSGLLACAAPDKPKTEKFSGGGMRRSDCISEASIRDYQLLDSSNLIVTAAGKRRYHIVLSRSSQELEHSRSLGFVSPVGRICAGFGEILIQPGFAGSGFGPEKIRIRSIVLLSPEDEEFLLIHFGLKDPEFEQPRTPQKVEGAVVEELD
jgi:hypothetical protein